MSTSNPPASRSPFGFAAPDSPIKPEQKLAPFQAVLHPPAAYRLRPDVVHDIDIAETELSVHPDLPPVPVWGYGSHGQVASPGPVLEATRDEPAIVRWRNRLPASVRPGQPAPRVPFVTAVVDDPNGDTDSVQNALGAQGGTPEDTSGAPLGWTTVHLHGGHSRADSDGWPDNMAATGGQQLAGYDNTYDNADLGLDKVGSFLWYHDHAMNGTRYHVYAGMAGAYLVRDPREAALGLPTRADEGEVVLVLQDRNLDATDGTPRLLHKTTPDTGEFFGPLTLVNGKLWPRMALRPEVYRLRVLNGSNARAYRLHLVSVRVQPDGTRTVTAHHDRVLVIGTDGGLLWRASRLGGDDALTLAPAERIDVLVDLSGLDEGTQWYLVNSAQAPFGGDAAPALVDLVTDGDRPGRNPYPWVMRLDIDPRAAVPGKPGSLFRDAAAAELNPAFRRLVHDTAAPPPAGGPPVLPITGHEHRTIVLAESNPPGHLYLQEVVKDPAGTIAIQFPGDAAPQNYRVENWMPGDTADSHTRVSFYDRVALRPTIGRWELWRFVNTTGDTHPMHIHQSMFQPLNDAGQRLAVLDANGDNLYNPDTRVTSAPLVPDTGTAPRAFDPHETHGWKDVVRVDPGNVVEVAIRFDVPGRYVYHCHVLEHEDTDMMRPIVVTVLDMNDGMGGMGHM